MPGQTWRDNGHKALLPVINQQQAGAAEDPAGARVGGGPSVEMPRLEHSVENALHNCESVTIPMYTTAVRLG